MRKKKNSMKTIALWFDKMPDCELEEKEIDIHINFWKVLNKSKKVLKKQEYFIDFGFMIEDAKSIEKLHLHFPSKVEQSDFEDLGKMIGKDVKYVNAIFNENYEMISDFTHPKHRTIKDKAQKTIFVIYSIDIKSDDILLSDCYGGTKVSIKIPASTAQENHKIYIRIRLKGNAVKYFIREYTPKNWFFQSAFTSIDAIDFRINEKRNCNDSLAEKITEEQLFNINKIDFLVMRDAQDDLIANNLRITCRELEVDLWQEYVGKEYGVENIIAYHWSEKASEVPNESRKFLDSFNAWVKIKYHKSNFKTIILYILIIGIMSISFNILSTCITNYIFNGNKQKDKTSIQKKKMDNNLSDTQYNTNKPYPDIKSE